ncbi:MAG: hypothetical protein K8U57_39095 [Planctomycetes bacterium]|nr:hypothetical protein [Planctomycetota bacterium]
MEIRIASYVAASLLLEREPNEWHALAMLDSDKQPTGFVQANTRSHLFLWFDDIEELRPNKQLPTRTLIEEGLNFAKGKDKLLVSCRAGRGRSVAMAYLIACQELGVSEALKLLDPTRQRPNRVVVSLGDSLLDVPGVLRQFEEWQRLHSAVRLSDYYEEMEKEYDALEAQGATNKICSL